MDKPKRLRSHEPACCVITLLMCLAICTPDAQALINPHYTPIDLYYQSPMILRVELTPPNDRAEMKPVSVKALKGTPPATLSLRADVTDAEVMKSLKAALADPKETTALLFTGDFSEAVNDDDERKGKTPTGALLIGTYWFSLNGSHEHLLVAKDQFDMHTVWAGGDVSLEQVIDYAKADPRADVPTAVGVTWGGQQKLANVTGTVSSSLAVDVFGDGWPGLFLAADKGDRLFRRVGDAAELTDVTETIGLDTRSKHAAWGDLNADGRLDLASCNGRKLTLRMMGATGRLQSASVEVELAQEALGVAVLAPTPGSRVHLLISTIGTPIVASIDAQGHVALTSLDIPQELSSGRSGPSVLADFDGDAICDVLQPRENGVLLFRGNPSGTFREASLASDVRLGTNLTTATCGDYDGDGQLDLLLGSTSGCRLLANLGDGKFRETLNEAGEVEYNSAQTAVVAIANGDFNNDGRQDFVAFGAKVWPAPFFNRGFRCFGFAVELNPQRYDLEAARATGDGQQTGTVADFNGDGAQDMAVVTTAGEVWLLLREAVKGSRLGVTVSLPPDASSPINVIGFDGKRCLGARLVQAGSTPLLGKRTKGPLKVQWKTSQGLSTSTQVIVLKPTHFTLPGDDPARGGNRGQKRKNTEQAK